MPARLHLRRPRTPEGDVLRACLELLQALGVFAWRNHTTGIYDPAAQRFRTQHGRKGVSDIVGILDGGRALFVECKSRRGALSPDQQLFLQQAQEAGALCVVARSVEDLIAALHAAGIG